MPVPAEGATADQPEPLAVAEEDHSEGQTARLAG